MNKHLLASIAAAITLYGFGVSMAIVYLLTPYVEFFFVQLLGLVISFLFTMAASDVVEDLTIRGDKK